MNQAAESRADKYYLVARIEIPSDVAGQSVLYDFRLLTININVDFGTIVENVFPATGQSIYQVNKNSKYNDVDGNYFIIDPPRYINNDQITGFVLSSTTERISAPTGLTLSTLANGKLNITVTDTSTERANINFYIYARTVVTDVNGERTMSGAWSRQFTINVQCDNRPF